MRPTVPATLLALAVTACGADPPVDAARPVRQLEAAPEHRAVEPDHPAMCAEVAGLGLVTGRPLTADELRAGADGFDRAAGHVTGDEAALLRDGAQVLRAAVGDAPRPDDPAALLRLTADLVELLQERCA
jgi:hypothetical protein